MKLVSLVGAHSARLTQYVAHSLKMQKLRVPLRPGYDWLRGYLEACKKDLYYHDVIAVGVSETMAPWFRALTGRFIFLRTPECPELSFEPSTYDLIVSANTYMHLRAALLDALISMPDDRDTHKKLVHYLRDRHINN